MPRYKVDPELKIQNAQLTLLQVEEEIEWLSSNGGPQRAREKSQLKRAQQKQTELLKRIEKMKWLMGQTKLKNIQSDDKATGHGLMQ